MICETLNNMPIKWPIALVIICLLVVGNGEYAETEAYGEGTSTSTYSDCDIKSALTLANMFQIEKLDSQEPISTLSVRHLPFEAHPETKIFETVQQSLERTSEILIHNYKLNDKDIEKLNAVDLMGYDDIEMMKGCKAQTATPICNPFSRYRTYDGSCNNLIFPRRGATFNCHKRMLPANYKNVGGFRESVRGGPLPTPRTVSINVHSQVNTPSHAYNNLVVAFGQLLAHEITYTPKSTALDNSRIDCCKSDTTNPQCSPLRISSKDPFYSKYNVTCLNNIRSAPCASCKLGKRDQMTQVTAFIDASTVYSNNEKDAIYLRNNDGTGTLKTQNRGHGELLPPSNDPEHDECSKPNENKICFLSGDDRCNLHPALTSMHTVFLREHNNVVRRLGIICPQWDEEKLFQETRRIIGAEIQAITYNEYLPLELGPTYMKKYNLEITVGSTTYNSTINPTIRPEFNTAAFRFGHSQANRPIAYDWPSARNQWQLRYSYFRPFFLYDGLLDPLLEKMTATPAQHRNYHTFHDVSRYLMKTDDKPYGYDLIAIDIMRGRDHGLPTYTQILESCEEHRVKITNWKDLYSLGYIPPNVVDLLRNTYRDPRDIDLFSGLLCEDEANGGHVGPTTACIIGAQFHDLKYGDRFYFEHGDQFGSFTDGQRKALKEVTLSKIICSTTEATHMPVRAMEMPDASNPIETCISMGRIDLTAWMHCE